MNDFEKYTFVLSDDHKERLKFFFYKKGIVGSWPVHTQVDRYLATRAKGIYKPEGWKYALSVRQNIQANYPDRKPVHNDNGSWTYEYFQEGYDLARPKDLYTNKAMIKCQEDKVPIGVILQLKKKPNPQYEYLGCAIVAYRKESGHFLLLGFNKEGNLNAR